MVSVLPLVVPEAAALRVETCPVSKASRVDSWGWLGVRVKAETSAVKPPVCGCCVSQGGSVAGDTVVIEKAEVPETAGSEGKLAPVAEVVKGISVSVGSTVGSRLSRPSVLVL